MNKYTDQQKDDAIRLYRAGVKGEDIAEQTGVPRPVVYAILKDMGLRPSRQKQAAARRVTVEQLLEQLAAANRENGRLATELDQCRAHVAMLTKHVRVEVGENA